MCRPMEVGEIKRGLSHHRTSCIADKDTLHINYCAALLEELGGLSK